MIHRRPMHSMIWPALGLALLVTACGGDLLGPNEGLVRFTLSAGSSAAAVSQPAAVAQPGPALSDDDGPRQFFQSANMTLSSILARNQDGVLENVNMELPVTVDILSIDGGRQVALPDGGLPAATYDQLVLVMTQVEGVERDGTVVAITPPGGGWTAIVPICPFTVGDGEATTVALTFELRNSFMRRNKRYDFRPRFTCDDRNDDGGGNTNG